MILLGPPTGERSGGCGERGGHLSVFWGPARVLQVPVRLAYFAHLLDVVQEEKPRARTRRWPEEEAPSIGGSDGRDTPRGVFQAPPRLASSRQGIGWRAGNARWTTTTGRVGFKCGTWSFFRLGEALSGPLSPRLVARALHRAVPGPLAAAPPAFGRGREVALGCDTFAGPEGAGGVL